MNGRNIYGGVFCRPEERQITTIGTGYLANAISRAGSKRAGATLTDKRVYFSGSVYVLNSRGNFVSYRQRKIVNTRDITGTGYAYYRPLYYVWWAILSLVLGILGMSLVENITLLVGFVFFIVFLITYFVKRKTLLAVEYAGGNIAFDVRWIQEHEQDDFIRNIHLAKDNLYDKVTNSQGFMKAGEELDEIPEL